MAKVFISYQRDDEPTVTLLAGALAQSGHSIWWDRGLGGDQEWRTQIAEQLAASEVVLTVWTSRSRDSVWVLSEADEAYKHRKLVQTTLDGTLPPKPFDQLQCLDLLAWNGDAADPRLTSVRDAIERVAARGAGANPSPDRPLPDNTPAERAWMLVHNSLEPQPYRSFLQKHANSPQACFAQKNLEQLEAWEKVDKSRPEAISEFLYSGPFLALGTIAKEAHAYAEQSGPSLRLKEALPKKLGRFVLTDVKIDHGLLRASYEVPGYVADYRERNREATRRFLATNPSRLESEDRKARDVYERSQFNVTLIQFHGGLRKWFELKREHADGVLERVTLDGVNALVETGRAPIKEMRPQISISVSLDDRYVFCVGGFMPIEDLRARLWSFDLQRMLEVCDGTASSSEITRRASETGPLRDVDTSRAESANRIQGARNRRLGGIGSGLIALLVLGVAIAGGWFYLQGQIGGVEASPSLDVRPYQDSRVVVARDDGSNYRVAPYAREDVDILAQTVSGEVLTITGVVHQPDGDWYQVRLRDGRTAYLKTSLTVPRPSLTDHQNSGEPLPVCGGGVTDHCVQESVSLTQPN